MLIRTSTLTVNGEDKDNVDFQPRPPMKGIKYNDKRLKQQREGERVCLIGWVDTVGIIMTKYDSYSIVKTVNCNYLFTDRVTTFNSRGNEGCHHLFNRLVKYNKCCFSTYQACWAKSVLVWLSRIWRYMIMICRQMEKHVCEFKFCALQSDFTMM